MKKVINKEAVDVRVVYQGKPLSVKAKSEEYFTEAEAAFLQGVCGFLEVTDPVAEKTPVKEAPAKEVKESKQK
jgi:hypothetical protein